MANGMTTDAVKMYNDFCTFTSKEMKKALGNAVKTSARQLKKDVKSSLRSAVKNSNVLNPKYNDTLQQGVRTTKVKETRKGEIYCYVTIASNRKTGSGSFRLHILEAGSFRVGNRYAKTYKGLKLKKPRSLGVLKPRLFFKTTEASFLSTYNRTITENINKAVEKINQKKIGK